MFVPSALLFDGKKDCADGSDECPTSLNEDMFSLKNEMISSFSLKIILWIIAPFAFFGNIYVFVTSIHAYRTVKIPNEVAKNHRIMIANLAVADGLMGVYLIILAISSAVYSGSFCLASKSWRVSNLCQVMGTLVIVSSQASVFILLLMGAFRFYTIMRPFESQMTKKANTYCNIGIVLSWLFALVIGIIPWTLDYFTTDFYYKSLFFKTDQVKKSSYHYFLSQLDAYRQTKNINSESYAVCTRNSSSHSSHPEFLLTYTETLTVDEDKPDKVFYSKLMPDTTYGGKFGFYSQNSICLPSYITRSNKPGWEYSIGIVTLNFALFIVMAVIYIQIV